MRMHLSFFDHCRGFFARFSPSKLSEYREYKNLASKNNTYLKLTEFIKAKRLFEKEYQSPVKIFCQGTTTYVSSKETDLSQNTNQKTFTDLTQLIGDVHQIESHFKTAVKTKAISHTHLTKPEGDPFIFDSKESPIRTPSDEITFEKSKKIDPKKTKIEDLKKLRTRHTDDLYKSIYRGYNLEIELEQLNEIKKIAKKKKLFSSNDLLSKKIQEEIQTLKKNKSGILNNEKANYKELKKINRELKKTDSSHPETASLKAFKEVAWKEYKKTLPDQLRRSISETKQELEATKYQSTENQSNTSEYKYMITSQLEEKITRLEGKIKGLENMLKQID